MCFPSLDAEGFVILFFIVDYTHEAAATNTLQQVLK